MLEHSSGRIRRSAKAPAYREETSTVAILRWAYQTQMVHRQENVDLVGPEIDLLNPGHGRSADGCARIAQIGSVGCEIDGGGYQRRIVHPDADLVSELLGKLPFPGGQLVFEHAKAGTTPHWDVRQEWEPIFEGGKAAVRTIDTVLVQYQSREQRSVAVRYCPIQLYPADEFVDFCRAEYTAWFNGLVRLTAHLRTADLKRWSVTSVGAKRRPWSQSS